MTDLSLHEKMKFSADRDQMWAQMRKYFDLLEDLGEQFEPAVQDNESMTLDPLQTKLASIAILLVVHDLDCRKAGIGT